jgi:hypothetical protein
MPRLLQGDESVVVRAEGNELGWRKVHGTIQPFSRGLGVAPYFSNLITTRINKQKPCNIVVTGEAGISKTYTAIGLARFIQPSFSIEQVAMTYAEVMGLMIKLPEGHIIVMDEPEYVAGHRDWYAEQNKCLVSTLRSGRFKVHPIFIPCINKRLLDKVIRENILNYMVVMDDRGEGTVYVMSPSHFTDETYTKFLCQIRIEMLDVSKCDKMWCYSCKSFKDDSCQLLRAQYEHKRQRIQDQRYRQDLDKSEKEEARKIPFEEWIDRAYEHFLEFLYTTPTGKERISTEKICLVLGCNQTMSQRIRSTLNQMPQEELITKVREHISVKTVPK